VNLVDSSAWLAYFAGEPNAGFFAGAIEDNEALLVLGLEENLAFADSVIYAVAKKRDATLWTQDVHFRGKPGARFRAKAEAKQ
jgi:predicted nucleic acid-binding protein